MVFRRDAFLTNASSGAARLRECNQSDFRERNRSENRTRRGRKARERLCRGDFGDDRRAQEAQGQIANRVTRLLAFLDAMSASAEAGTKDIARLAQARDMMTRRLNGHRSSSSLPTTIDHVLSRPVVSAPMIAKGAKVMQRAALNLISELGVCEVTWRGRYRAWGIV